MFYAQSTAKGHIRAKQGTQTLDALRPVNREEPHQGETRHIDRDLMFHVQSTVKSHIRANKNVFLPQEKIMIHYLTHISPLRVGEMWRKGS